VRFLVDPQPPDIVVRVALGDPHAHAGHPRLFDSGGTWQLHRLDDGVLFTFFSPVFGPLPYKTARVRGGADVDVRLNRRYFSGRAVDPLEYPLDELIVITALSGGLGLEIHGCGVLDADGRGYLFAGQSGAGKSTVARLWLEQPGATVLSDDRVIVRPDGAGFRIYGTPWHGEAPLASPAHARLAGVFLLRQDDHHGVRPLPRALAAARLFASSFPLFHDASAIDFSLELLDSLTGAVPCAELGFTPAGSLVDVVRCAVLGERLQN